MIMTASNTSGDISRLMAQIVAAKKKKEKKKK